MRLRRAGWLGAIVVVGLAVWEGLAAWSARTETGQDQLPAVATVGVRAPPRVVTALGRLAPRDELIRLAGPSDLSVVIARLDVDEGDRVEAEQVLGRLDTYAVRKAALDGAEAEFKNARSELARNLKLHKGQIVSDARREEWELKVDVAQADLDRAKAELERALLRAPIDGVVVKVHARRGERVGSEGILELGRLDEMFAVAEVYETDIGRVRIGQRARITTPVLAEAIGGQVEWINLKVGKLDVLGADPAAKTDARVVEVEIRLDDSTAVRGLTNLQVKVEFEP